MSRLALCSMICSLAACASGSAEVAECLGDQGCRQDALCVQYRCVPIAQAPAVCEPPTVVRFEAPQGTHAATDGALIRVARCLRADRRTVVLVEGNADRSEGDSTAERLVLGAERALDVARQLEVLGVPLDRLRLVTYGAVNPDCTRDDARCRASNRRVVLRPLQGPTRM